MAGHALYVEEVKEISSKKYVTEEDEAYMARLRVVLEVEETPAQHVHLNCFRNIFELAILEALSKNKTKHMNTLKYIYLNVLLFVLYSLLYTPRSFFFWF
jgi:hypothetical protein